MTRAARTAGRSRFALLATIGAVSAVGPFGTDLYLPAMPQVGHQLSAPDPVAQLTLPAYIIGLGIGQFLWGPISDRIGRRLPLIIGLSAFTVTAFLAAFAPTVAVLIGARLAMGFAGSAGIVVGRAVVRDLYSGIELARIFARLSLAIGVAPVVAPVIGGALLQVTDWRGTFVALGILGVLFVTSTALWVPETLASRIRRTGASGATQPRVTATDVSGPTARRPARRPASARVRFVLWTGVLVASSVTTFTYITFIAVVLQQERHVSVLDFSLIFALNSLGVIVGGQTGGILLRWFRPERIVVVSQSINVLAAVTVLSTAQSAPLWILQAALFTTVLQGGVTNPLSTALALQPFDRSAGMAAAIVGGSQFALGALLPALIATGGGSGSLTMGTTMVVSAAATFAIAAAGAWLMRRSGSPFVAAGVREPRRRGVDASDPVR